jgi:chloride channel protein, CIC family
LMKYKGIDAAPVIESGRLVGIVATIDIARLSEDKWSKTPTRKIMTKVLSVGYPDETLSEALTRMTKNHISHLPIVDLHQPDKLIGFLAIHNIALTYDVHKKTSLGEKV